MDEAGLNLIPADLTVEDGGKQVAFRDTPFVKESADFGALLKRGYDSHRAMGGAVRFPAKDAKAEDIKAFRDKVYSSGHFTPPPESPDKYEFARPDGTAWNDAFEKQARVELHKAGFTQAQATVALELHKAFVGEANKQIQDQLTAAQKAEDDALARGMEELKKTWGADFDRNKELIARAGLYIFGTPEEAAKHGFTGNSKFLSGPMLKIAKMLEADDGFMQGGNSVSNVITEARKEIDAIRTDKAHPMHERYLKGDSTVRAHMEQLYQQEHAELQKANGVAA